MLPPVLMRDPLRERAQGKPGAATQRRLLRLYRSLDAGAQDTLLAFAEFLAQRGGTAAPASAQAAIPEPAPEPRPADETVIGAIKRLRRTYAMLDSATMLQETSSLMAAHVLQGREAAAVIDELEALFATRYDALKATEQGGDGGGG
ncbi:hypothetical protein [uncultured Thiohalocapsa sp.]|uniref:hypothetical protein n=1 Tax=uncultured Thiohalocapsa sp. TaxID=768990 RepID=UPI0025CE9C25|nr:hypothetical protein [uncultured Thiohalocapsa sp.]